MKRRLLLLSILPPALGGALAAEPDGPEKVARELYSDLRRFQVTGLPEGEAWEAVKPKLSGALAAALEAARKEQRDFRKKFPDEKPPWIEGDLFSSLFEGFQTFTVKPARIAGETAAVPVEFVYTYRGETTRWTDTLLLERSGTGWVVDDVRYGATWDFANKGTLQKALAPEKPAD